MERIMIDWAKCWLAAVGVVFSAGALFGSAREAVGQSPRQTIPALGMYALPVDSATSTPLTATQYPAPTATASHGPLARLVHNPQQSEGLPPFALTDQTGRVQRYVEPVPGVDLEPYVGQIVIVRHDTGQILLATQLDLPPQPLHSLLEDATGFAPSRAKQGELGTGGASLRRGGLLKQAQFADDDDGTVQLLDEGEELPDGGKGLLAMETVESIESGASVGSDSESFTSGPHMYSGEEGSEEIVVGPMPEPLLDGHGRVVESYPHDYYGVEACPECGGYHVSPECGPYTGRDHGQVFRSRPKPCKLFGDVEINFLRTHLPQTAAGKLSEKYEFSPRVIVGFRETGKVDGRVRYWTYDRDTRVLGGTPVRVDFDVFDVEGTHSFAGRHSEVTIGAGFRLASIDLTDDEGRTAGSDLIGMTLSADGRAPLFMVYGCRIAAVYGARLSILGGDWGGPAGNDFTGGLVQDDSVIVHELLGGVDVSTRYRDVDVHARLGFEMQNWHSDALSQNAGTDSIGFLGPGLQLGAEF